MWTACVGLRCEYDENCRTTRGSARISEDYERKYKVKTRANPAAFSQPYKLLISQMVSNQKGIARI